MERFLIVAAMLGITLYAFAEKGDFPLTPEDIINSGLPLFFFEPNGSPYRNSNPKLSDGLLAVVLETNHRLDNYFVNPVAFNSLDELLRNSGLTNYALFRFVDGLAIFVNRSDYAFIHSGVQNDMIDFLKSKRL